MLYANETHSDFSNHKTEPRDKCAARWNKRTNQTSPLASTPVEGASLSPSEDCAKQELRPKLFTMNGSNVNRSELRSWRFSALASLSAIDPNSSSADGLEQSVDYSYITVTVDKQNTVLVLINYQSSKYASEI